MPSFHILNAPDSERLIADDSQMSPGVKALRETTRCPCNSQHVNSGRRISPLYLQVSYARRDEQMIWYSSFGLGHAVHETLLAEYEREGFTGYETKAATVLFKDGSISDEYREFVTTGWAGMAGGESGIRLVESCDCCNRKRYSSITNHGQLIDWEQWTGDDFFIVWPMPLYTMVTERVAAFLKRRKVKSFWLMDLEDRVRLIGKSGFTPGRFSNYFPDELAIKYGMPLGLV